VAENQGKQQQIKQKQRENENPFSMNELEYFSK
jgi:hypothetical protein